MRSRALFVFVSLLVLVVTSACQRELMAPASEVPAERTLIGRVLLPPGEGSRGVEVIVTSAETAGEPHRVWVLFNELGRFRHRFRGRLTEVLIATGIQAELRRIGTHGVPRAGRNGVVDVGVIDLRDQLVRHRLTVRAAEGAPPGEVRMAMCFGLPPTGPRGERIALGSRQFPPIALGSDVHWLLPRQAGAVYFLAERPHPASRPGEWRSGAQTLFGPFALGELPGELVVD